MANKNYLHDDIQDSPEDKEKLKPEETTLDLPELKDIPGAARSLKNASLLPGDTTISSADEEGDDLLDEDDEELSDENDMGANVSRTEKKLLRDSLDPSYDTDLPIHSISLDRKDDDGVELNESGMDRDLFGEDLDDDLVEEEDEESEGEA
ncbi:MAG TPA: hypothetical protein VFE04_06000 [Puia sp.]|nr:hypothetical protein [Puia sp.]